MAVIGTGTRGNQVHTAFIRITDVAFVAACDVAKSRLDQFASKVGGKIATYGDYRRVLENKDVEAVLVSTPDHWHSPIMMAACEAGKDVYVEKPVSNAIEPALKMIDAARIYNRVVQVGLRQRSWHHFQECAKMVRDGYIGKINQCVMLFGGGGGGMRMGMETITICRLANVPVRPDGQVNGIAFLRARAASRRRRGVRIDLVHEQVPCRHRSCWWRSAVPPGGGIPAKSPSTARLHQRPVASPPSAPSSQPSIGRRACRNTVRGTDGAF
jgi:hypothetical protein